MGILAKPFAYVLTFLYSLIGNYAWSIIVFSFIVRMAMYPLYKKQILSTAGMSEMQPKMQAIQRKYANDRETMNQKLQELYKEENYSPTAGCLPMIIQMFILMGLFALLRTPMLYLGTDEMMLAVHDSFLWIPDLTQPDPWILPTAVGVVTFIAYSMNSMGTGVQSGMMQTIMKALFPIMMAWLVHSYAAGIGLYWLIGQFVQIFFNIRFSKLRKEMKESKNKKKKKAKTQPV